MTEKKEVVVIYILTKLELGGAQKVCLTLFNEVHSSDIITYLISGNGGVLVPDVATNARAVLLPTFTREVSWNSVLKDIKNFFVLIGTLRSLKKKHPNARFMVHTHSTKAGIVGRWAAYLARIPYRIHTIHGYGFHDHQNPVAWCLIYFLELITSFITTHFVCVSTTDTHKGAQMFYNFKPRASLIRAGVQETNFYKPAEKINMTPNIIFGTIACFKPQKNIADLIKAFHLVFTNNPHARLEIIGDGALRKEIEHLINFYQLTHIVTLHGWHPAPHTIMQRWHTFVLSSLWEGLPCSVVEARLLGLPVISYDTGGINEVIHHGANGLLFPKKEWRNMAYSMLEISKNRILHEKLASYPDDLSEFSNSIMVNQHRTLYEKLVK